ncbi:IS256 family transposase [Alkalihalobacillus oceani]|uniref:IS256 family transposase n=1 Tax=Halalkalibacter oceani TaxID=1653776 RepID=UPI00203BEE77|nr:IS256 family transposase [Halalkalibacter oceani]MCM3760429.1 IS256 family transposase [Halalkalibacter oceani]
MSTSIGQNTLENQLDSMVREFVKEKLETMMKEEMNSFFEHEHPELKNQKNGFYQRQLDTKYGRLEDLQVPRDRENAFQTEIFSPYQRREQWLGETIITMYQKGVSTREIGQFIERILGHSYSAATISQITDVVAEDIESWQQRPLKKRYSVLYLDGTYLKLRRDDVANEVVYLVVGVTEDGFREILGFYVGGQESALGWKTILNDLYHRGLEEVLLGVFDGLPGLEEAMKAVYPKADVQRCVVHKVRNALNAVRKKDQSAVAEDLKPIYKANTQEEAKEKFRAFKDTWQKKYPKVVKSWEQDLDVLLTFLTYPSSIQPMIYTTNIIERTIKEIKKRTKTMNSLPTEKAAEKIVYLQSMDYNQRWAERKLRGFSNAYSTLQEMFKQRYGTERE